MDQVDDAVVLGDGALPPGGDGRRGGSASQGDHRGVECVDVGKFGRRFDRIRRHAPRLQSSQQCRGNLGPVRDDGARPHRGSREVERGWLVEHRTETGVAAAAAHLT